MIETYLILTLLILHLFFKVDRTKAYCGIFAFSGKRDLTEAQMKIALWKIHILGLYNQSRGVHGCGLFIGNEIYKGTGVTRLYSDFIAYNEFDLNFDKGCRTIIGHCRQASRGDHSEENTHPFLALHPKKKELDIVGVHNGTIPNIWTLCTKYKVLHNDIHNDSKALYEIIVRNGVDVLEEYEGGAALLWSQLNENRMFAFHGMSKEYAFSVQAKEERPLYYLETEDGIFFSSIEESLYSISENASIPMVLEHNKVFEIVDGKFISHIDIDRSAINKIVPYQSPHSKYNNTPVKSTTSEYPEKSPYIWKEKPFTTESKVVFCNGRFYLNGELCKGQIKLDHKGVVTTSLTGSFYMFYRGVMILSVNYSTFLNDEDPALIPEEGLNFAKAISKYSIFPVFNLPGEAFKVAAADGRYKWYYSQLECTLAFTPKFSPRHYTIENGSLKAIKSSRHNEKTKESMFYTTFKEAFEHKVIYFERAKNPLIPTEKKSNFVLSEKSALNTIHMCRVDAIKELTQNEYDALYMLGVDYYKETNTLLPDANEITFWVQGLIEAAIEQFKSILEILTATEIQKLYLYLEQLENESKEENKEKIKEMVENKLKDAIESLEVLNNLSDDLEVLEDEFAQESHMILSRLILSAKKEIKDLAEKHNSQATLTELSIAKLTV